MQDVHSEAKASSGSSPHTPERLMASPHGATHAWKRRPSRPPPCSSRQLSVSFTTNFHAPPAHTHRLHGPSSSSLQTHARHRVSHIHITHIAVALWISSMARCRGVSAQNENRVTGWKLMQAEANWLSLGA